MIDKGLNAGREWSWSTIVRPTNNRMIKRVMTNQVVTRFFLVGAQAPVNGKDEAE